MGGVDRFVRQLRRYDHQQLRRIRHRFYGDHPQTLQHLVMALAAPDMVQCFRNLVTQLQSFCIHDSSDSFSISKGRVVQRQETPVGVEPTSCCSAGSRRAVWLQRLEIADGDWGFGIVILKIRNRQSAIPNLFSVLARN